MADPEENDRPVMDPSPPVSARRVAVVVASADGGGIPVGLGRLLATATPPLVAVAVPDPASGLRVAEAVLVPLRPAPVALARALAAGTPPPVALAEWRAEATALLAACRRARRRVVLIDPERMAGDPETVARVLGRRLGAGIAAGASAAGAGPADPPSDSPPDSLCMVLAELCLAADAEALDLAVEIDAMLPGAPPAAAAAPVLAEHILTQRTALHGQLAATAAERDSLAERLEQTEAALADATADGQALQARLAQTREEAEAARAALSRDVEAAQEAATAAQAEVQALRHELDAARDRGVEQENRLAMQEGERELLLDQIAQLQVELQWQASTTRAAERRLQGAMEQGRWRNAALGADLMRQVSRRRALEQRLARTEQGSRIREGMLGAVLLRRPPGPAATREAPDVIAPPPAERPTPDAAAARRERALATLLLRVAAERDARPLPPAPTAGPTESPTESPPERDTVEIVAATAPAASGDAPTAEDTGTATTAPDKPARKAVVRKPPARKPAARKPGTRKRSPGPRP